MSLLRLVLTIGLVNPISSYAYGKSDKSMEIDEFIVVTASSVERSAHLSPLSITQFNEDDINHYDFNSQADILRHIPGLKVEGGGGEVASNIAVLGMPFAGQFEFTPLLYDGLPAFSTFGLNSSAFDVYMKTDLSLDRLEYVRGGVSNLFGPGSTVGLINYIAKSAKEQHDSIIKLKQLGDNGSRLDFLFSKPSSDSGLLLSGYYRYDEGPIATGLPSKGYQLKAFYEMEPTSNSEFKLSVQYIDDSVQFYLPLPLDGNSKQFAIGNGGSRVNTLQTDAVTSLFYDLPNMGKYRVDARDGVLTKGGSLAIDWQQTLRHWHFSLKGKYADYDHEFNLFLDGDGLTGNIPLSINDYLAIRGIDLTSDAELIAMETGNSELLETESLIFGNRMLDRNRPAEDLVFELSAFRDHNISTNLNTITAGIFYSDTKAYDINWITGYLTQFNNKPNLLDLQIVSDGQALIVSDKGLVQPSGYTKYHKNQAERVAVYLVNQLQMEKFNFDMGIRFEKLKGRTSRYSLIEHTDTASENKVELLQTTKVVDINDLMEASVSDTANAFSLGVTYKYSSNFNIYANHSDSYYFPQIRTIQINSKGQPNSFEEESLKLSEIGLKYKKQGLVAALSYVHSELKDRKMYTFINDGAGNIIEQIDRVATSSNGLIAFLQWPVSEYWGFSVNAAYQDLEFTAFDRDISFIGKRPSRTADLTLDLSVDYTSDNSTLKLMSNYVGETYANNANSIKLDDYFITSISFVYQIESHPNWSLSASMFNLFDSRAVTEGSPRQGDTQEVNTYFVGRPILPRRLTLGVEYRF